MNPKTKNHPTSKIRQIIAWTLVFFWMSLIVSLSAQPAQQSDQLSRKFTKVLVEVITPFVPGEYIDNLDDALGKANAIVRKQAHVGVYFVLGFLTINAFRRSGIQTASSYWLAFSLSVAFAVSDEIHQLYVPGRSGEIMDVLYDSTGALLGIGAYGLLTKIKKQTKKKEVAN
ncbi:VanZ family protein [Heliorestis convoluta]|nr:VanZ family protein [Heliorestis convoluta]